MGVQEIVVAIPSLVSGGAPDGDALRTELIAGLIGFIADDVDPITVDPHDAELGGVRPAYVYGDGLFKLDAADTVTAADGVYVIILAGNRRYKRLGDPPRARETVKSRSVTTPPDPDDVDPEARPSYGDAYLVVSGTWTVPVNSIAVWSSLDAGSWREVEPDFGPPLYIEDEDAYLHWAGDDGWVDGLGAGTYLTDTIPLAALIGLDASFVLKVENQTTYAPPGSRKTGATPTAPKGGTAANLNDNDDTTVTTTSALGDLTGQTVGNRIVARLALAVATDLIALEARGVTCSTGSSSATACGLYYSTNSGSTWTQAGAGFTLTTTAQDVRRTGSFAGVTDIALVTEAKAWSTATHTVKGLNAFDATVVCAVGVSYIAAANSIGVFAGNDNKVMRCEVVNTFTAYTQTNGDTVFDKALNNSFQWNSAQSAWISAGGSVVGYKRVFTAGVLATGTAGSGGYTYGPTTAPSTQARHEDTATITHTAKNAANILEFTYQFNAIATATQHNWTIAIRRANSAGTYETNSIDWLPFVNLSAGIAHGHVTFSFVAGDISEHIYRIAIYRNQDAVESITSIERRTFILRENTL